MTEATGALDWFELGKCHPAETAVTHTEALSDPDAWDGEGVELSPGRIIAEPDTSAKVAREFAREKK